MNQSFVEKLTGDGVTGEDLVFGEDGRRLTFLNPIFSFFKLTNKKILVCREHGKIVYLIRSNDLKNLSHGGKLFPIPTLNATFN
jgi:hypothetical protein